MTSDYWSASSLTEGVILYLQIIGHFVIAIRLIVIIHQHSPVLKPSGKKSRARPSWALPFLQAAPHRNYNHGLRTRAACARVRADEAFECIATRRWEKERRYPEDAFYNPPEYGSTLRLRNSVRSLDCGRTTTRHPESIFGSFASVSFFRGVRVNNVSKSAPPETKNESCGMLSNK
jgi:hypothetical protein